LVCSPVGGRATRKKLRTGKEDGVSQFVITGAAGFIGSNLASALLGRGHAVVGVDNLLAGKRENLAEVGGGMTFLEGDVRDLALMRRACEGADYVLHHAALASVPWSMAEPALAHEHNVTGTLHAMIAARDAGVRRFVLATTSAVYGDGGAVPSREDQPLRPESPYAATKLMGEQYAALFARAFGLSTVGLRYFNVFGPRQDPGSAYAAAIPIFVRKALAGEAPVIFGDGEQTRDFVYVEDVVEANLLACAAGPEASGEVFNIGGGASITVNALCREITALVGGGVAPVHAPRRAGDVLDSRADIGKARRVLGFAPRFSVADGLRRAIGWYEKHLV
jgi:nucleoside-diphosphate-sugar epimerase